MRQTAIKIFYILFFLAFSSPISARDQHAADSAAMALKEAELERDRFLKEMEMKNRPGTKAADFAFVSRDGKSYTLHSRPETLKTILIFYNPDCHDCHEAMERIDRATLSDRFRILAIDAEEDREMWEKTKDSLPAGWTVGFSTDPIQEEDIYILPDTPTIYILDRDNTVILKETDVDGVLGYAAKNP